MPKTAFLFPGQGSQKVGMGKDLAEKYPAARAVFDQADEALGRPSSMLCFEGPEEQLTLTENTQPAILTCSIATLAVLGQHGVDAQLVAGHSLGEYSALVAAGCLRFQDAVRLVQRRGRYMQEATPPGAGAMAAILGLPAERVEELCRQAAGSEVVSPANLNSPAQVVIAGNKAAVDRAVRLAQSAGALKAVMLPVSAPFHCALMKPAQERLAEDLRTVDFFELKMPLVNNVQAKAITSPEEARAGLEAQVPHPVRWQESVLRLKELGVERFVEVGPGRVLTGLLRSIDRSLNGVAIHDAASLEKFIS